MTTKKKNPVPRKKSGKTQGDYAAAKQVVQTLELHTDTIVSVTSIPAFRKYLPEIGVKQGRKYITDDVSTEKQTLIKVFRIN